VAVDKHEGNLQVLHGLVPEARIVVGRPRRRPGEWEALFDPDTIVVVLHAQITGKYPDLSCATTSTRPSGCSMRSARAAPPSSST
jgi:hypothetical protein